MSTTVELGRMRDQRDAAVAELDKLREQLASMADSAIAAHDRHLHDTRRSAPDHRPCESGARAMFAKNLLRLLSSADS